LMAVPHSPDTHGVRPRPGPRTGVGAWLRPSGPVETGLSRERLTGLGKAD
jgi:hypothetical protein